MCIRDRWYTAQHSADQTPDSSHVWSGFNPYSGLAGFLNAFTANERAALLLSLIHIYEDQQVEVQIRGRTEDGRAFASNIMTAPLSRILKDGVI